MTANRKGTKVAEIFSRTEALFGKKAMQILSRSRVAVFGVGGVGGYAVEALARSGIGALDVIDNDKISLSNINRQIIATVNSVGRYKAEAVAERIKEINPDCSVMAHKVFFLPENSGLFDFSQYDYVLDAIDTVTAKISIIENAKKCGVRVISCMGTGNKADPSKLTVADISETSVCPLARVMRRELKNAGISGVKVVYSKEEPLKPVIKLSDNGLKRDVPASCAFVPSSAGLLMAGEVIKDLIGFKR